MNQVLSLLYTIFYWIMLFRFVSALMPIADNPLIRIAYNLTEPILQPVRKIVGVVRFGNAAVDLSPLVVIIVLNFLRSML